jgi:hypothetical protein
MGRGLINMGRNRRDEVDFFGVVLFLSCVLLYLSQLLFVYKVTHYGFWGIILFILIELALLKALQIAKNIFIDM